MTDKNFIGSIQRLMGAAASQQKALSKNIANLNTPGYRRAEVDFQEVLREIKDTSQVKISRNDETHLSSLRDRKASSIQAKRTSEPIPKGKVNNVDMDSEMGNLAKTQLYYEMLARVTRQRFMHLKTVINGKTS